jgi:Arc/MetJ-type ribon-helix-helix transcriptional regulator
MGRKRVSVFLGEDLVRVVDGLCRRGGLSRSRFVREAVEGFLRGGKVESLVKECLLRMELDDLFREEKRLRRLSDKILADNVYLGQYAKKLMLGGFEDGAVRYRPPLTSAPNAAEVIRTFEGIFCHRLRVGKRLVEVAWQLYPGEYELSGFPSSDQNNQNRPVKDVREEERGEC